MIDLIPIAMERCVFPTPGGPRKTTFSVLCIYLIVMISSMTDRSMDGWNDKSKSSIVLWNGKPDHLSIEINNENSAIDSFIARTCNDSTTKKRGLKRKYRGPFNPWGHVIKGFVYGIKTHVSQDMESITIIEWGITAVPVHDSSKAFNMIDSVYDHEFTLMDAPHDSLSIYDYSVENTHAIPVIDTNGRKGLLMAIAHSTEETR